jgi:hypothetical protein
LIRVAPTLLVALLLGALLVVGGIESYGGVAAASIVFAYAVVTAGRLLHVAAGERSFDPSAWYVFGLLATCLALYGLTAFLPLSAAYVLVFLALLALALDFLGPRQRIALESDWRALAGFALCAAFTAAWCIEPARAYETVLDHGILPVWGDYFVHAARISEFGDSRALGRGSIFLAGYPPTFYHFASYFAAAPLAGLLDRPGLALSMSAWLPLGVLAMASGAYVLGERLSGAAGGIAALAVVAILPDASDYGLRNGFLSFHWSIFAHPGAMYALGAAFLSLAFLDRWREESARPALVASALLAASILLFRAHVFLLYLPAWLATAAYCRAQRTGRRRIGLGLAAALGVAAGGTSLLLSHLERAFPGVFWRFEGPALGRFLEITHSGMGPTAYTDLYAKIVMGDQWGYSMVVGIGLAFLAALGAFVLLLPIAALLCKRRGCLRSLDIFPAFLAYAWLLLMLFAPLTWAVHGPELIDRPVVLLYACAGIWSLCLILRWLVSWRPSAARGAWWAALLGALLALPVTLFGSAAMAKPKFDSGKPYIALHVAPGVVDASAFLRAHALPGDAFAVAGLGDALAVVDLPTQICALSGMPTLLARPHLEMIKDGPRARLAGARLAALHHIDREADYGQAMTMLRRLHVQWYVVPHDKAPRWDPDKTRAAFRSGTISLYRTGKDGDNPVTRH